MRGARRQRRPIALLVLACFVFSFAFPPSLLAQPFARFSTESRGRVQSTIDRAEHLASDQDWTNYVSLGIATERARWEDDAQDLLTDRFAEIERDTDDSDDRTRQKAEARTLYASALAAWEGEAEDQFFAERGQFRARLALNRELERITEEQYESALARADAETSGLATLDLTLWDEAVDTALRPEAGRREESLSGNLNAARAAAAGLGARELTAFQGELARLEAEIRQEFQLEDSYHLKRGRNRYLIQRVASTGDARLEAEAGSAEVVGQRIIAATTGELTKQTEDMLALAVSDMQDLIRRAGTEVAAIDESQWSSRVEAIISAGLRRWELAEEELFGKRLAWMAEAKRSRAEAERVWSANHENLQREMERWVRGVQEQVRAGRAAWAEQYAALARSRERAELDLQQFVTEKARARTESARQLRDLVEGGGRALLEAKEARRSYEEMRTARGWSTDCALTDATDRTLCQFYVSESQNLATSILSFERILLDTDSGPGSQTILRDILYGEASDTGLLVDRRQLAGDLPERIAELSESNFEESLRGFMTEQDERFVLYRKDILGRIDANRLFVDRTQELLGSTAWQIPDATTLAGLQERVNGLGSSYTEQREELQQIIHASRPDNLTEPEKLALIQSEIAAWVELSRNRDARLRSEVLRYFRLGAALPGQALRDSPDGSRGLHATGNENDPYLLTEAELEWELLRRERNALAVRFERAQEVKRYADLAARHEAGLELADITRERARAAEAHAQLAELHYVLARGDIPLDPRVYAADPVVRDAAIASEVARLRRERGIDGEWMERTRLRLEAEAGVLAEFAQVTLDSTGIAALRERIAQVLQTHVVGSDETETTRLRNNHRLTQLDKKLAQLAGELAVLAPGVLTDRWTSIQATAQLLDTETRSLLVSYNPVAFAQLADGLAARVAERTPTMFLGDLSGQRDAIQTHAVALTEARRALDAARESYRAAYLDLHILTSGDGASLIEQELASATNGLSSVLERIVRIEGAPGFAETMGDALTAARTEYLKEVSAGERAAYESARAQDLLPLLEGLDGARARLRSLEDLIAAQGTPVPTAEGFARLLLEEEGTLTLRNPSDARTQSDAGALAGIDTLRSQLAALASTRSDLVALTGQSPAPADAPARRAELEGRITLLEAGVKATVERTVAAIRGEVPARAAALEAILRSRHTDGSLTLDPNVLTTATEELGDRFAVEAFALGERASARLAQFLADGSGETFEALVARARGELTTLPASELALTATGFGGTEVGSPDAAAEWRIILQWLLIHRAQIEQANLLPNAADPRTSAERWENLLEGARILAESSAFQRGFRETIPDSAEHAWVLSFRAERARLRDLVSGLLLLPATEQSAAFAELAASDRSVLEAYRRFDPADPVGSLRGLTSQLSADLGALPYRYREIYLRETAAAAAEEIARLEPDPSRAQLDLLLRRRAAQNRERTLLAAERDAELDPALRSELEGRISALDAELGRLSDSIASLKPTVDALEARLRQAHNQLAEARAPGSTSALYTLAASEMLGDLARLERHRSVLGTLEQVRRLLRPNGAPRQVDSPTEQLLGALGFAVQDRSGRVLRDGAGRPVLTAEGLALATEGVVSLAGVFGGQHTGPHLVLWTMRLQSWLAKRSGDAQLPAEVRAAVEMLEESLRQVQAAQLFVRVTRDGASSQNLVDQARAQQTEAARSLADLGRLLDLEGRLESAIEEGARAGVGTPVAALAVFQSPEALRLLGQLSSLPDSGQSSAASQVKERANELLLLGSRLRAAREQDVVTAAQVELAELMTATGPENYRGVDRALAQFRARHPQLDATAFLARVSAVDDNSAHDQLLALVGSASQSEALFAGAVASVLAGTLEAGDLRAAAESAVRDLAARLAAELAASARTTADKLAFLLEAPVGENSSIIDLVSEFAQSRTRAENEFLPALDSISALPPGTDPESVASQVRDAIDRVLGAAGHALARGGLLGVVEGEQERLATALEEIATTSDPAERALRTEQAIADFRSSLDGALRNCVAGWEVPDAAGVAELTESLLRRDVARATDLVATADSFPVESLPAELREVIVLREFDRARERRAQFHSDRLDPARAPHAVLDLDGLGGEFARWLVVQELHEFQGNLSTQDFLNSTPEGIRVGSAELLAAFAQAHPTKGMTAAVAAHLRERILVAELARLEEAALAAGGIHLLDERAFLSDFAPTIAAARIIRHTQSTDVVLSGATMDERRQSYASPFSDLLASSLIGATPWSDRVASGADREALFQFAFSLVESGAQVDDALPAALRALALQGRDPRTPVASPDELLPATLRAITDFATRGYHAVARSLPSGLEAAIRRLDLEARLSQEDLSVILSDAEVDALLGRAVGRDVPAEIYGELAELVRTTNHVVALGAPASMGEAIAALRAHKARAAVVSNEGEERMLRVFEAAHGPLLDAIERRFFDELASSSATLRQRAKEDRGAFLAALVEQERRRRGESVVAGGYSESLPPAEQAELAQLAVRLFADGAENRFSAEERGLLLGETPSVATEFQVRSGQELIESGLFETVEGAVFGRLARTGDSSLLAAARADRPAVLRDFLDLVFHVQGGGAPEAFVGRAGVVGLDGALVATLREFDPELLRAVGAEQVLVRRFLSEFLETRAERDRLVGVLIDPAMYDPLARNTPGYDAGIRRALILEEQSDLSAAVHTTVADHTRGIRQAKVELERSEALGRALNRFVEERGADEVNFSESRFGDARTYLEGDSFSVQFLGLDPEALIRNGDWENSLRNDDLAGVGSPTGTTPPGESAPSLRTLQGIRSIAELATGGTPEERARRLHHANVANHYLTALTRLAEALAGVATAAALADGRLAEAGEGADGPAQEKGLLEALRAGYDPTAPNSAGIRAVFDRITTARAAHGTEQSRELAAKLGEADSTRRHAEVAYAAAGRRKVLHGQNATAFVENTFRRISERYNAATRDHDALVQEGERLRLDYSRSNSRYVESLNGVADAYRRARSAQVEAERLRAVADYALTPYLFAATGSPTDSTADAENEYERARAALAESERRLSTSAARVLVQSRVDDFARVAAIFTGTDVAARTALMVAPSDEERSELATLRQRRFERGESLERDQANRLQTLSDRALFAEHRSLMETRIPYVEHALRTVRIEKARHLVNAEIQRREAVVAARQREFQDALNGAFPLKTEFRESAEHKAAQVATYRRLASIVQSGGDLQKEYRGWYYGTGQWLEGMGRNVAGQWAVGNFAQTQIWPSVIAEAWMGGLDAGAIPPAEARNIALFQQGGSWAGYDDYAAAYGQKLVAIGTHDAMSAELAITTATMSVLATAGTALIAGGTSLVAYGGYQVALGLATLMFGGYGLITYGTGLIAAGAVMIGGGMTAIATATATIAVAATRYLAAVLGVAATDQNTTNTAQNAAYAGRIKGVAAAEQRYQEALAALEYFKKAPDQKTAKERLQQWGAQHRDPDATTDALYTLTQEDLSLLFDRDGAGEAQFVNSNGVAYAPDEAERGDYLDLTTLRRTGVSRDVLGNRFVGNPNAWRADLPGPLEGGYYRGADGRYAAIRVLGHNGQFETRYAKLIEDTNSVPEDRFYDLGEVLGTAATHGAELREARRDAYFEAGDSGADEGFAMRERAATLDHILTQSGDRRNGGVEFGGYRLAFEELLDHAGQVDAAETAQRQSLQRAEWDLRAAELREREAEWERRFAGILERGSKSWAGVLNRFRQDWRNWEKEFDRRVADGDRHYQERIREHFDGKQKWELDTREQFTKRTVTTELTDLIGRLNTQIGALNVNANLKLEQLNALAEVQKQIVEIEKDRPGASALLLELNASIEKFNTQLGLSEVSRTGGHGKAADVAASFQAELKKHERNMGRHARAVAAEQLQDLLAKLKEQIRLQNEAVDSATATAAARSGFMRQGNRFIKLGLTPSTMGVLDAYQFLDGEAEIARMMSESGFSLKSGDDLKAFLMDESRSDVEVTSFFEVQRLAAQSIFAKIMGTGNAAERATATDAKTLGTFGRWAGRAPDQQSAGFLAQFAGLSGLAATALPHAGDMAGFGELGAFGSRPSGTPLGFYVQLQLMGAHIDRELANAHQIKINPVAAGFGAVLPVAGLANSYLDYRLNTEVRGLDGSQARTELNNKSARAVLKSGGMLAAGLGTGGVAYAGMASIIAGNTLQNNGHFQLTDRGAVGIGSSSLALMGLGAGANVISGGFEFDEKGHSTSGWSLHGARGDAVGAGILGSALGGAIGADVGSGLGATLFGQGLGSAFTAYGQKQTGNEAAWQGLLAQDIETTLAGAGGILHNSISIQKNGGPQGGSFLGNLVNGIAAPFQQLYAMGAYAVSGFQYLFRDAQKESRAALELDSYGGNFDEALDRLMREGHTRNQALSILYGVVLTQRERRADTYGPEAGDTGGIEYDPDQKLTREQMTTLLRSIREANEQNHSGSWHAEFDAISKALGGRGGTLAEVLDMARARGLDVSGSTLERAGEIYTAAVQAHDLQWAREQPARDARAATEAYLRDQQATLAAKSPAYAALLANHRDGDAVRRVAADQNLSDFEKRAILTSVRDRWIADGSYGRIPVDIEALMPLDRNAPRNYTRMQLLAGAFNETVDGLFPENAFWSNKSLKLSNMQLSDGDRAWLQSMQPYGAPIAVAMAGIAFVSGRGKGNSAAIGAAGERFAMSYLQQKGYTDIIQLQNKSGHGIDIIARNAQGLVRFFEVKSSAASLLGRLSPAQQNINTFVSRRLDLARGASGAWQSVDPAVQRAAINIARQLALQGGQAQGMVIRVQNALTNPSLNGVTRWIWPPR